MEGKSPIERLTVRVEYLAHADRYCILCAAPVYPLIQEALVLGLQQLIGPHLIVTFDEERYPQAPRPWDEEERPDAP